MKFIEIAVPIWGRHFIIKLKIREEMAKEKTVRIRIVDSFGIGYTAGYEYDVLPSEAQKLIKAGKAVALTTPKTEKAIDPNPAKAEKRG